MRTRITKFILRSFALAFLAAGVAGCISPSQISRRIVTAPNLQNPSSEGWTDYWFSMARFSESPMRPINIPVGPPDAVLSAVELPAADYQLKFTSSVTFRSKDHGDFVLKAFRETNAVVKPVAQRGTVVLLHGYAMQRETMMPWAFVLAQAGYRVVLVDLRGHGRSTGEYFTCGKYEVPDLVQMLDYLQAHRGYEGQVGVLGLSFGADLGLLWAARDARVRTVVAMAPYDKPEDALVRLAKVMKIPVSADTLRKGATMAAAQLQLDWPALSGDYAVRHLKQPVLFIGGANDTISPVDEIRAMEALAPAGSDIVVVPKANHFVIGYWFDQIQKPVTEWFAAHLTAVEAKPPKGD